MFNITLQGQLPMGMVDKCNLLVEEHQIAIAWMSIGCIRKGKRIT